MNNAKVTFQYVENGRMTAVEVDRDALGAVFNGLVKGYADINDNEISLQILPIIPKTKRVVINKDFNETQDVPGVAFHMIDGTQQIIKIMRRHKVVWAVLESYRPKNIE